MTVPAHVKKLLASFRKRKLQEIKDRKSRGECCAVIYHGPGHQSKAFCQMLGKHNIHMAVYGCYDQKATWKGMKKFTGFFDDPPRAE